MKRIDNSHIEDLDEREARRLLNNVIRARTELTLTDVFITLLLALVAVGLMVR